MPGFLVVLTGASGGGKTTLARAVENLHSDECAVFCFDSIGVPSPEMMQSFGPEYQPGGAWQRAMTFQWIERIAENLRSGESVLFEGQVRIAFIREALAESGLSRARIILVDCDDATRRARLCHDRGQPELATADMMNWSRYLRDEAIQFRCPILDTGKLPLSDCVALLEQSLNIPGRAAPR